MHWGGIVLVRYYPLDVIIIPFGSALKGFQGWMLVKGLRLSVGQKFCRRCYESQMTLFSLMPRIAHCL